MEGGCRCLPWASALAGLTFLSRVAEALVLLPHARQAPTHLSKSSDERIGIRKKCRMYQLSSTHKQAWGSLGFPISIGPESVSGHESMSTIHSPQAEAGGLWRLQRGLKQPMSTTR
ncbi:hypothetical protein BDV98DRAFT_239044 [Pterulicium gracile]|uniref:Secreted protein n=1 Tax=Pterulicium gracile TaxID=1884261 RepID=A0A5C3QV28_9AGAR|nr:hypothetical protein BDV98DRAFT_239044 [Pterula gracilis]